MIPKGKARQRLAWRIDALQFRQRSMNMGEQALVSIVMPTYKLEYFEDALDSVLGQTYPALELIICDDSSDERIATLVEQKRASAAFPIRYFRNETRLGELGSTAKGIRLAEGEYVKFLQDDDVLLPECVETLVGAMEREPNVVLASSRRLRIDEEGQPLPDILATCFPFAGDVLIDGRELVSFLADHTINFIGEPSCLMARRDALLQICERLMMLNGRAIDWIGDLAMCAQLLQRGDLAFLSRPLTRFRVSRQQFSQIGRDQPGIGEQGHADFRLAIRELGWYRQAGDNRFVRVAPITRLDARVFKPVNLLAALRRAAGFGSVTLSTWLEARRPDAVQKALIDRFLQEQGGGPRFAVLVLDTHGDTEAVERTLQSLEHVNSYPHVESHLFAPLGASPRNGAMLFDPAAGPIRTINQALARLDTDWLLLVEAGVEFTVSGLLVAALDLLAAPESCQAVYADELMRLDDGELGAALRPDLNLDLLLSFPAGLSRHWLFRREPLLATGGFDETAGEAFELAYQLRLVEQRGLGCIGHISEPLLSGPALRLQDSTAERAAIEGHLRARGYAQATVGSRLPGRYELDYGHAGQPPVSILVLAGERLAQLQRCVETVLENTAYPNYEILLLEQGGEAADVREWLLAVEGMGVEQVRVLRGDGQLSRGALRNLAASRARGEFLLWLDAGSGILDKDWLQQLLNHGQRPEVGAVGAKLLAADGRVCHAGWLLGLCGPAGRAFEGRSHEDAGYLQRLQVDQNYSAVAGECLLMRRELFLELGGFDEALTRWDDVDICLRAVQAGYLNVWTPRARLLLDAPATTAASVEEEDALYTRWLPLLARDPAYNPGFSLQAEGGFKLADPQLAWRPLQGWRPCPLSGAPRRPIRLRPLPGDPAVQHVARVGIHRWRAVDRPDARGRSGALRPGRTGAAAPGRRGASRGHAADAGVLAGLQGLRAGRLSAQRAPQERPSPAPAEGHFAHAASRAGLRRPLRGVDAGPGRGLRRSPPGYPGDREPPAGGVVAGAAGAAAARRAATCRLGGRLEPYRRSGTDRRCGPGTGRRSRLGVLRHVPAVHPSLRQGSACGGAYRTLSAGIGGSRSRPGAGAGGAEPVQRVQEQSAPAGIRRLRFPGGLQRRALLPGRSDR
uniref:Flagellar glycosyl transferase n=1 Tax=Pseudomonas aeruginosa TaxID=287 RepID=Q9AGH9_PSEAI|nr:flagellar glycosyl transferase [Pseudomonas aeruginosa]